MESPFPEAEFASSYDEVLNDNSDGFSPDEILAMAARPVIAPEYYAADLHVGRLPDWIRETETVHVPG